MGTLGTVWIFDAAHDQAFVFNAIDGMGILGTVFHACCLLETTTNAFHIRTMPMVPAPAGAVWVRSRCHPPCAWSWTPVPIPTGAFTPSTGPWQAQTESLVPPLHVGGWTVQVTGARTYQDRSGGPVFGGGGAGHFGGSATTRQDRLPGWSN
jgi:hypothetical protein